MLFFKGLIITTALKAGFIHKTLFIYVGLLTAIFLKEKITKSMMAGFLSLVLGSILFLKIKIARGNLMVIKWVYPLLPQSGTGQGLWAWSSDEC